VAVSGRVDGGSWERVVAVSLLPLVFFSRLGRELPPNPFEKNPTSVAPEDSRASGAKFELQGNFSTTLGRQPGQRGGLAHFESLWCRVIRALGSHGFESADMAAPRRETCCVRSVAVFGALFGRICEGPPRNTGFGGGLRFCGARRPDTATVSVSLVRTAENSW